MKCPSLYSLRHKLVYKTNPRQIAVEDWRLGVLSILIQVAVVILLLLKLWVNFGYAKVTIPRFTCKNNVHISEAKFLSRDLKDSEFCLNASTLSDTLSIPPAVASKQEPTEPTSLQPARFLSLRDPAQQKYKCKFLDNTSLVYPVEDMFYSFIATRITVERYEKKPKGDGSGDDKWKQTNLDNPETSLIAGVQFATLRLSHTLIAAPDDFFGSGHSYIETFNNETKGYLEAFGSDAIEKSFIHPCDFYKRKGVECPDYISVGCNGQRIPGKITYDCSKEDGVGQFPCSCTSTKAPKDDIIAIGTLLDMAGISLRDESKSASGEINWYSGVTLLVKVEYSNMYSGINLGLNELRYVISVEHIDHMEYKVRQPYEETSSTKVIYNRHGVRLIIMISGRYGSPHFDTLVVALIGVLATAAVVYIFLDIVAFSLMSGWRNNMEYHRISRISGEYEVRFKVLGISGVPKDESIRGSVGSYLVMTCNFQKYKTHKQFDTLNLKFKEDNEFTFKVQSPGLPGNDLKLFVYRRSKVCSSDTCVSFKSLNLQEVIDVDGKHLTCDGTLHDLVIDLRNEGFSARSKPCQVTAIISISNTLLKSKKNMEEP